MIKRISRQQTLNQDVEKFCQLLSEFQSVNHPELASTVFSGDIETSYSARMSQANDNSVYQVLPQAILFPKTTEDVLLITELANHNSFSHLKFTPKGGGTGTNGQALSQFIIVDMSRYMRQILELNVAEGWVRVQSGVIKDELNDFLRPHGFFFAPDLSTSNRATIGGMINTDASGQGSLVYGKTSDHIIDLQAITIGGDIIPALEMPMVKAKALAEESSDRTEGAAAIYRQAIDTCVNFRDEIKRVFPRLNRYLTGYDLEHTVNDALTEFNLAKLLAGSEGTLAFITEAKLTITKIPTCKTMVNISYDSFDSALRNSPFLVDANATSVETVDSKVLGLAKEDVIWSQVSDLVVEDTTVPTDGLNIVEFNDEDIKSQTEKVGALCAKLDSLISNGQAGVLGYKVTEDLGDMAKIYAMRKKSVGLLGNTKGRQKPIAFVEDTAVPPEHLADYIAEFRQLLDSHNLDYGMFGHVDAGVLHVRPALDLSDPEQEQLLRTISDQVVKLTAKYNGLMWGEHGKGYRSEYGPDFFGDALFTELRKIKAAFDPHNRLNPGKICTPIDSTDQLVSVDAKKRAYFDKSIPTEVKSTFESALNCNGNGLCFNYDTNSPMCPSYKATSDRRYSPKGRATLMREWLRLQGDRMSKTDVVIGRAKAVQWFLWPVKLLNTVKGKLGQYDFSHEVKDSMDACLACKACTTACPIKVDVPTFRSRFIEAYYNRYLRPVSDHLVANVELLMPKLSRYSFWVNLLTHNPISKLFINKVIGYVDAPKLTKSVEKLVSQKHRFDEQAFGQYDEATRNKTVFIVQDAFTSSYESDLIVDTIVALDGLGYHPLLLPFKTNGKPQHVKGFLAKFKKTARQSADYLNKIAQYNRPMIGLDASMVLTYRDEYVKALGADKIKFSVQLLSEWLNQENLPEIDLARDHTNDQFTVLNHCTEKSIIADSPSHWQNIFNQLGLQAEHKPTGCCGMAGTFGHEKNNQSTSRKLYELSWQETVEEGDSANVLATGFSCRCQSKRMSNVKLLHPIQILASRFSKEQE